MGIKKDVDHRSRVGWMRWKMKSRVLCDDMMPIRLKTKS